MARAKLINYTAGGTSLTENPIHQVTSSRLPIDATTWSDADPGGKKASKFTLETIYTEPVYGEDDFEMAVDITFTGSFKKTAAGWKGKIEHTDIFKDGELAATVVSNGKVNLSDFYGQTYSGVIWDELALNGLKGSLSKADNYFNASSGNDVIKAGAGHDRVGGYDGNDKLFGQAGHDWLVGFNGDDKLFGGNGNDDLQGLAGDDVIFGGRGRDVFRAEDALGTDTWTGGAGKDKFEVGYFDEGRFGATVTDFDRKGGDKVDLTSDQAFFFFEFDEIRYIRDAAFSGEAGDYEVRMENGIVEIDNDGDGEADLGIKLEGMDTFGGKTNWLVLPDGFDFV
ncbi:MAG: hypothetical protein P1U75_05310 [Antarcticimicrobium sp.]|uniref:calcium-binding protein n=1 Tax=Antarcticimicrobium sp. TaxID=2824147 RepID=UPI00261CA2B4|nr:hypothetical protein [Antarcticimicrobium sp.]MDF1716076.1 hypothetical protein [Antarcticimicrobium sp.]